MKHKVKNKLLVNRELVDQLACADDLDDDEVLIPVDMREVSVMFDDPGQMVRILGPKAAAEAFIRARELLTSNKDEEDEPMSAQEQQQ